MSFHDNFADAAAELKVGKMNSFNDYHKSKASHRISISSNPEDNEMGMIARLA